MQSIVKFLVAMYTRAAEANNKERGATATEYALLVAFIALAIIVGVTAFGGALNGWFQTLSGTVAGWAN